MDYLEDLSANDAVQQGLSWILATFAGIAVAIFSREKEENAEFNEQVDSTTGKRKQTTESSYLQKVMKRHENLRGKHEELREAHKSIALRLYKTQSFARRQLRSALVLSTALFFAVASLVAAGFQTLIKSLVKPSDLPEPFAFMAEFPQSLALLVCAFIVPFVFYRRYIRNVKVPDLKSSAAIGFFGILAPSLFGFLVQGPEIWSVQHEQIGALPYFDVQMMPFVAVSRLVVFPIVGLVACWTAASSASSRSNSRKIASK